MATPAFGERNPDVKGAPARLVVLDQPNVLEALRITRHRHT